MEDTDTPPGDRGFILQAAERTYGGRTEIHLLGRLQTGETFAVVDRRATPSFFIRASDEAAAQAIRERESPEVRVVPSDRRTMDGSPVLRLEAAAVGASQRLRDALHRDGVRTYEADIKPSTQLLMDLQVHGTVSIRGPWRQGRRVSRIYENPQLAPADWDPQLTVLSLDIETDARAAAVYAVALVLLDPKTGETTGEVLLDGAGRDLALAGVKTYASEETLLAAVRDRIVEMDPDIITGWNVIDFDFRVLARRFAARGVPFDLGRADTPSSFLDREGSDGVTRWRRSKAIVPGRQVLDGMWLARIAGMGLEDYRLETAAQAVLGRGKRIDELPGESRTAAVERLYRAEPAKLCEYCLEDTRLALDILLKEGLLDIALRKSLLIGVPLEQTSVSVAGFEFLYTEHLHRRGIVAPTLGIDQDALDRAPGGGIITPRAGLSHNVLAFDYKSLYPSIMRTFNIDPLTRIEAAGGGAAVPTGAGSASRDERSAVPIEAPNGARFSRQPGILPGILDRFFESREAARLRGDKRAVYAYKIVMNSFYGVLGTPGCRFAASQLAGAITTLGQRILFWTRDQVASLGYEVIYGDTDSLFVRSGAAPGVSAEALAALGGKLAQRINELVAGFVRSEYGLESRMELEFEAVYRRFFLPPMRTVSAEAEEEGEGRGRAKGYAGLKVAVTGSGESEVLEVVGMEAVRHDWTPLAQELQKQILDRVFHDAPAHEIEELVSSVLRELRAGKRNEQLVYRKALRKPVEAYTKSSPPHARAAALLPPEERSGLIRYVWTAEGPQPESRRTAALDYEHYVEKQLLPIVESIGPYIGLATDNLFSPGGQLGLF